MSTLSEAWNPPLRPGWFLPTDLDAFLVLLRRSPGFGTTDHARLEAFMALPQAEWMPESLHLAITAALSRPDEGASA